ncbi:MAG: hypothetical protein IPP83_11175 [Flavobacteriales bacterium]|nr:hypothetical protein [Flavobacteriales bacterium]
MGFTMDLLEVRLSNLMAFDAKPIGTWGCKPELHPEVVDLIASGKLDIHDFVEAVPCRGSTRSSATRSPTNTRSASYSCPIIPIETPIPPHAMEAPHSHNIVEHTFTEIISRSDPA